jgi:hypothetical protein
MFQFTWFSVGGSDQPKIGFAGRALPESMILPTIEYAKEVRLRCVRQLGDLVEK